MPSTHEESLLDSGIEESFPASDPVSVFVHLKQKPLPGEKVAKPFAWRAVAMAAPALLGLVGVGVRLVGGRRQRGTSVLRARGLALGALVAVAAGAAAALRRRKVPKVPQKPLDQAANDVVILTM